MGLIIFLVVRYKETVNKILNLIQTRIEAGSSVKAGPFALGELKPQSAEAQKEKLDVETTEFISTNNYQNANNAKIENLKSETKNKLYAAEDLALRAIQEEFEIPLQRNVRTYNGKAVDAAVFSNGITTLIEVKIVSVSNDLEALNNASNHLNSIILSTPSPHNRGIVCLVYILSLIHI